MPRRPAVPSELAGRPFRGSDAVRDGLLTRRQLESSAWVRLMRNVYVHRDLQLDPDTRMRAVGLVREPATVVCGLTAAWVFGAWEPFPGTPLPLETTRGLSAPGTPVDGLRRRRLTVRRLDDRECVPPDVSLLQDDVVMVRGLPVTTPLRTCFDLVRRYGLVEAVAFADSFGYNAAVAPEDLRAMADDRRRWPGVVQAREVADLAHPGARSRGESRLRMIAVLAGLGEPLVNEPVCTEDGEHLATPDLLFLDDRPLAVEYDGGYHDEGDQPAKDRRRQTRFLAETDIPLLRYDREDVRLRRDAIAAAMARKTGRRATTDLDPAHFVRTPIRWE